jgi:uncharacterized protein YqfA (UPF0365 family)
MPDLILLSVAAFAFAVALIFLLIFFVHFRLWLQAMLTGTPISFFDIIGMRLRKTPPELIVRATIALRMRGTRVSAREVEVCYLAAAASGDRVATAEELADLVEDARRKNSAPQT